MKVSIICPLYNAENYIETLHKNILKQKKCKDEEIEINYVLTESKDLTEVLLKKINANYFIIPKNEFSHSKTREMMAYNSNSDIIVFISQDVIMINEYWLCNLIKPIINNECEAAFSRQLCTNNTIEKYVRNKNYPNVSRVVSKKDIEKYGLLTFFYSDASSAIKTSVYKELGGYDNKNLIINEDMYIAYKIISNGYRIKYCAESQIEHSHVFTLKQLYNRYFDTGVFLRQNDYLLNYKSNDSGIQLAKHVLKQSWNEKNYKVFLSVLPNFGARFIGSNLGKRYKKLSENFVVKSSLNKTYWNNL